MKNKTAGKLLIATTAAIFVLHGCGPSTNVSVGVGVAVPGPWIGPYPYPGGGVVVGRPVYPGYPFRWDGRATTEYAWDMWLLDRPERVNPLDENLCVLR